MIADPLLLLFLLLPNYCDIKDPMIKRGIPSSLTEMSNIFEKLTVGRNVEYERKIFGRK